MPTFDFTSPDGKTYSVDGPDGATSEQAFKMLQQHLGTSDAPKVGIGEDLAKSAASIPGRVVGGTLGIPGDLLHAGMRALGDNLSPESNYGSQAITKSLGSDYEAKTVPGQLTQRAGDLLPLMIGGPETLAAKVLTRVAAPAVGGEIGSAVGGPVGDIAGTLAGAAGGALAPSMISRFGAAKVAQSIPQNDIASAAQRLGVDFPKIAASDNLMTQRLGASLKELPYLGDPLVKASKNATEQMGKAAERIEAGYGSGSIFNAGDVAKTGIEDWATNTSKAISNRLYDNLDKYVKPNVLTDLAATKNVVSQIQAERQAAGLAGAGKAVDHVSEALQNPNGLTFAGLKTLRTSVGEMLDSSILPADIRKTELKRIYGSLSEDLKSAVYNSGLRDRQGRFQVRSLAPDAFEKANSMASAIADRREALVKIIGKDASAAPERIVDRLIGFASGSARADIQNLGLVRKTIGGSNWDEVASAAVSKLGRDMDGKFSPERFLTSYGKLSQGGKQMLFGSTGKQNLFAALEDIATLSRKAKELASYGNPSGTGRVLGGLSTIGAAVLHPHVAIPSIIGLRFAAKALAAPIRPKAMTLQVAQQNPNVRALLEHALIKTSALSADKSIVAADRLFGRQNGSPVSHQIDASGS